jgi:hypothetical protein
MPHPALINGKKLYWTAVNRAAALVMPQEWSSATARCDVALQFCPHEFVPSLIMCQRSVWKLEKKIEQ